MQPLTAMRPSLSVDVRGVAIKAHNTKSQIMFIIIELSRAHTPRAASAS